MGLEGIQGSTQSVRFASGMNGCTHAVIVCWPLVASVVGVSGHNTSLHRTPTLRCSDHIWFYSSQLPHDRPRLGVRPHRCETLVSLACSKTTKTCGTWCLLVPRLTFRPCQVKCSPSLPSPCPTIQTQALLISFPARHVWQWTSTAACWPARPLARQVQRQHCGFLGWL